MIHRAIIENNNNDDKNGKVQVRIFGLHTKNNEKVTDEFNSIATSDLPWAEVMGSTDNGLISGIGLTHILRNGTMVWVILDNNDPNFPIVIGTVSGKPTIDPDGLYDSGEGFCDPNAIFPFNDRLNEYDTNRLARVEDLEKTIHKVINDNLIDYEPESTNNLSEYPYVKVLETESGHVIETDDTPNNERIRVFHKSGSYCEFKSNGDIVVHTENDDYKLVRGEFKTQVFELMTIDAKGKLLINGEVKIVGGLETTGKVNAGAGLTSGGQVADKKGNLSSLRDSYDKHNHVQNNGNTYGGGASTSIPSTTDGLSRATDFIWENK